jgi:hypothetical protein
MKLSQRIDEAGLTMEATEKGRGVDPDGWEHVKWDITLRLPGRKMSFPRKHGMAAGAPEVREVMDHLLMMAGPITEARSYEEWASEWSSNPAEWFSREDYAEQVALVAAFGEFLGDLNTWLYETDRDED